MKMNPQRRGATSGPRESMTALRISAITSHLSEQAATTS